ncbi:MAG: putative 7-carboxy-7-deazaguanine synthase QueE [Ruminococcus sp.]|nr:putative 7-carboxy-7-deazaguanine synthase QueE [Ruminococcus sp.]
MSFAVVEKFASINGESLKAGELAVFIRFRGCNLNCSYCDTSWANTGAAPAKMMTAEEICDYADSTGIKNVTLTGGEPLLQEGIDELIERLIDNGHCVEIETNGSIDIEKFSNLPLRPAFTLDYKLGASGMEENMLTDNYKYLKPGDCVKFVSGSIADLKRAREIIRQFDLTSKCSVYISPVFGQIDPADIVDFLTANRMNDVRLQLQMHKFIWGPDRRGV